MSERAWIGGFLEVSVGGHCPWFSLEVKESWAPWAFAKGSPKKTIAALELLATLGSREWPSEATQTTSLTRR